MVKFQTKFNEQTTKDLNKFGMKRIWWLLLILSVLFIYLGVMHVLDEDIVMGIIWIALGVLYAPLVWLLVVLIQKSRNKTMPVLSEDTEQTFTFTEEFVEISMVKGEEFQDDARARYSCFFRVNETKTHYFFYLSRIQSYVVPKADITEGTFEELNELLAAHLGKKFKALKK